MQLRDTFSFFFYFQNYMCLTKKKKAKKSISFGERHAHQAIFQPRLQHLNNTFTSSSCINIMQAMISAMKISSESLTLWFIYQSHEIIICFTFSFSSPINWLNIHTLWFAYFIQKVSWKLYLDVCVCVILPW